MNLLNGTISKYKSLTKKLICIFLCAISLFGESGCYDMKELDDLAYAVAIGLDIGKTNFLRMSLMITLPLTQGSSGQNQSSGGDNSGGGNSNSDSSSDKKGKDESGKEAGGGEKGDGEKSDGEGVEGKEGETDQEKIPEKPLSKLVDVITVETPTIFAGINILNQMVSKQITLSHVKLLVISEKLAKKGIDAYLHALVRNREIRPDIYIAVSKCGTEAFLKMVNPILEDNPAEYFNLLFGQNNTGFMAQSQLFDFYFHNETSGYYQQPVAAYVNISNINSMDDLKAEQSNFKEKGRKYPLEGDYLAGNLPVTRISKTEAMGTVVFLDGKMAGILDGEHTCFYLMLTGKYNYANWSIPDPRVKDRFVVVSIKSRRIPKIRVDANKDKPVVTIDLKLEGDFMSIQSGEPYEHQPEIIEKAISDLIGSGILKMLKTLSKEYKSDIIGFGKYAKMKFLTTKDWLNYNWKDKYTKAAFTVKVDMKIRRTGLMVDTILRNDSREGGIRE